MFKGLLTAKVVGGAVAGTGAVVAGGICIDRYIKSKESSDSQSTSEGVQNVSTPRSDSVENQSGSVSSPVVKAAGDTTNQPTVDSSDSGISGDASQISEGHGG